jgi:hypothetical protein
MLHLTNFDINSSIRTEERLNEQKWKVIIILTSNMFCNFMTASLLVHCIFVDVRSFAKQI